MARPAVELRHVSKTYREGDVERVVLRDVSATIWSEESPCCSAAAARASRRCSTASRGSTGPRRGSVVVDGTELTALDEQARTRFRRRHIGFVFQFYNLIRLLTVEENVLLPLDLNDRADAAGLARARARLDRVGGRGDSFPERLSGGEQQRVAVARALVHDPALVLRRRAHREPHRSLRRRRIPPVPRRSRIAARCGRAICCPGPLTWRRGWEPRSLSVAPLVV